MQRASDAEIFERALQENRIIITADTDFGFLLAEWQREKPSVVLLRRIPPHPENQLKVLRYTIETYTTELTEGSVVVVEPGRVRIRKLPLFP